MRLSINKRAIVCGLAVVLLCVIALPAWGARTPKSLRIVTNPQGSLFYRVGTGVAKVLSKHLTIPARVQPYAGTSVALPLINSGEVEMGVNNTNDVRMAYRGLKPFLPTPNLRLVTVLFPLRVAMFVPNNSDIRLIKDLRGKRVSGEYKAQLAVWFNVTSILATAGMGWNDVKMVPTANVVTGTDLLIEGRVDATLFALGAGKVKEANAKIPGGIRFLSINDSPAGVKAMQKAMPGTYPMRVKKGSTVGVTEDITVEGYDVFVITSTNISDKAVADVVMALQGNVKDVRGAFPGFRKFSEKTMVRENVTIPYHPGAIKVYKKLGLWSKKMDTIQSKLLSEAAK